VIGCKLQNVDLQIDVKSFSGMLRPLQPNGGLRVDRISEAVHSSGRRGVQFCRPSDGRSDVWALKEGSVKKLGWFIGPSHQ